MSTYRLLGGAAAVALLAAAPAAMAQQTTAGVRGAVTDGAGKPIAGATLTVTHQPTGSRVITRSDAQGLFDLRGLRAGGPYLVQVTAPGFGAEQVKDVYLTVADAARVDIALAPAGVEVGELVVTGARASRLVNAGSSTGLQKEAIESVVSVKRDIRDIGRRDPLATLDLGVRGTGPSGGLYIAGSTPRSNRITIDGVRSQDDFGLNTGGLSTNRGPVSPEAIDQISIQAVPFDVQEGDFTGGALSMVLRSGGNDFHGSLFRFFRSSDYTGTKIPNASGVGYRKLTTPIDEKNYGAFISGPIWEDRLFFAASYEKFETIDLTDTGPADGGFANTINGLSGAAGPKLTTADLNSVLGLFNGYAASAKLKPGGIPLTQPVVDEKSSIKIDWNIADGHRLAATYRHAYSSVVKRQNLSATAAGAETDWYSQPENEDNYSLQLNSRWSDNLSTEARIAYRGYQRGQIPPTGQNFSQVNICTDGVSKGNPFDCIVGTNNGQPTVIFGPDQFRHANVLKTKDTSADLNALYRWNRHLIKVGYQYKNIEIFNLFVPQARGIYYFDSQADFTAGKVGQFSYQNAVTGNPRDAAAALQYRVNTLFLQDSWDVSDKLVVNYGLRYDMYSSDDKPARNPNFVGRYGFNNQTTYDGIRVLMPRLSAKYDDDSLQVSGGVGLVSGGIPDVFLGNRFSNTGILTNGIVVRRLADGSFFETGAQAAVSPTVGAAILTVNPANPNFGFTVPTEAAQLLAADSATRRTAETNSLAPGFDMPTDWKANLSLRKTAFGLTFGADLVYVRSQQGLAFRDLRARLLTINGVQQYTPDGRLRYDGLNITAANRAALGLPVSANPDLVNLGSTRDIQAFNPSQDSWSRTAAFSVRKEFRDVSVGVSYTVQKTNLFGGLPEFATTDSGLYGEQYTALDPNTSTSGRAANEIKNAIKFDFSYRHEFFKGYQTRVTLFGDVRAGRPINFLMSDVASGRSPVFGVNRTDALAFIPKLDAANAVNPLRFDTGATTVFFDSQASLDRFKTVVNFFGLPQGGIVPKGYGDNPDINRFDLQLAQEVPVGIPGHKVLVTLDVANIGNMLSKKWGVVKEYSDSRSGGRIVSVQCADMTGAALNSATAACPAYRYSNVSTSITTPTINPEASVWSVLLGLKYQF